jgi:hypothetical protein
LRENESGIFLISGLDTISENQKRFAGRVNLSRVVEQDFAANSAEVTGLTQEPVDICLNTRSF